MHRANPPAATGVDDSVTGYRLREIYEILFRRYGPQHWWPADTPFEVIVGAILTQSAAWTNVEKAIVRLKETDALAPAALRRLPQPQLAALIRSSGYYNAKSIKLKAFAEWLGRDYGDDLDRLFAAETTVLREQLLAVHGIGEETADSIILYAANRPVFVIDAYTRRIITRLGMAPAENTYAAFQSLFMQNLPPDSKLFNEYHALFVRLGKENCRKKPVCSGCCLNGACTTINPRMFDKLP